MSTVKVGYVQWPEELAPSGVAWDRIRHDVAAAQVDLLVTNEMPFGTWLPESTTFDKTAADRWVDLHSEALEALSKLEVSTIISSRPVWSNERLANEAFLLQHGTYRYLHQKKYFPQQEGVYEESWFEHGKPGFDVIDTGLLKVGVLLCTELFFNEHARAYGRAGADLIVAPRSSGMIFHRWKVAGQMAAIVSGAYVVSSNRYGTAKHGQQFGGKSFAISPEGNLLGETNEQASLAVVSIDLKVANGQKTQYPCYVKEL